MCDNPICNKKGGAGAGAEQQVKCVLCQSKNYCSAACAELDFQAHNCPNAQYKLARAGDTIFREYAYEDMALSTEEELKEAGSFVQQRYLGVWEDPTNPARQVQKAVVPITADARAWKEGFEMGYGKKPTDRMVAKKFYNITIKSDSGQTVTVTCAMPRDAIYRGNKDNKAANQMAGGDGSIVGRFKNLVGGNVTKRSFKKEGENIVFWPDPRVLKADAVYFALADTLQVEVNDTTAYIRGAYNMPPNNEGTLARVAAKLKTYLKTTYELKFSENNPTKKGKMFLYDLKYLRTLYAEDNYGVSAAVTFLVNTKDTRARLVDVEISVPEDQLFKAYDPNATSPTTPVVVPPMIPPRDDDAGAVAAVGVDLRDLDDVTALVRAQTELIASGELQETTHTSVMRKYQRQMEESAESGGKIAAPPISDDVQVAHHVLMEKVLFGRLRKYGRETFNQQMQIARIKKYTTDEQFQQEFDRLIKLAEQSQNEEGNSGDNFLQVAEQLVNIARQDTKKHAAYVVKGQQKLRDLQQKAQEIKKEKKSSKK